MAKVTADAFDHSVQNGKVVFPGCLSEVGQSCDTRLDVKREATKAGFEKLVELLDALKAQYKDEGKNIAAKHTDVFIGVAKKLIEKLDTAIWKAVNES